MKITNFSHAGNTGDVIASLPALRQFYRKTGRKPILFLVKDHPAEYYEGATHPVKDENGNYVSLNKQMIDMLIPLLKCQDYLEDVKETTAFDMDMALTPEECNENNIHINLSKIRDTFCNIPNGAIQRWYFYVYPDLACDLTEKWLYVQDAEKNYAKDKLIVARTERYLNENIDYSFLKKYEDDLLFAGTMREYNNFCMNFDLCIPKLHIENFLQLAQALKQSKGLLSNQTMIFQIAEGLKIPRIVELCAHAPNVIPMGEYAYDFYAQLAVENYAKELYEMKKPLIERSKVL